MQENQMNTKKLSVLEQEYVEADRPYSQNELNQERNNLYINLRLANMLAKHKDTCNHIYYVKENGRKYKYIETNPDKDPGSCSVCWKLKRTPKYLQNSGYNLVNVYMNNIYKKEERCLNEGKDKEEKLTYDMMDTEKAFYVWLYKEFDNPKGK
jgi:hypothetical protein